MARLSLWYAIPIFLFCLNIGVRGQGQCYFPPEVQGQLGYQATEQRACDAFAETSLCCSLGWTCFSNKLCVVTDEKAVGNLWPLGTALRGTCTNPQWDDTVCGSFCLDDPVQQNNGSLEFCGNGNWCCGPAADAGTCDCQSGKGTFSISDGQAQTIIDVAGLGSTSTFFTPASTAAASTSSSPTTSGSPKSTSLSISSTSRPSSTSSTLSTSSIPSTQTTSTSSVTKSSTTITGSKTPASTSSHPVSISSTSSTAVAPASAPQQKSLSITHKPGFIAGMAILGCLLFLALALGIAFLVWRRRRSQRLANLPTADDDSEIYPPPIDTGPPVMRPPEDPYAIAIPPRSPKRNSPLRGSPRGSPVRGPWGRNEMTVRSVGGDGVGEGRTVGFPYIMPYEGT